MSRSSASSINPADKVKAWIQQVSEFEPLQEQTHRSSTPDHDQDRHPLSVTPAVRDGPRQETRSTMLSRSQQSGIRSIKSEPNPVAISAVTLSRSYVRSSQSLAPKILVSTVEESPQSTTQTPRTCFMKLKGKRKRKGKGKGKEPANAPTSMEKQQPGGDHDEKAENSLLGQMKSLQLLPQTQETRSFYSSSGSPSLLYSQTSKQHLSTSIRFTALDAGAAPPEVNIEDDPEFDPEPEITSEDEVEPEPEPEPKNHQPETRPFTTLSDVWPRIQVDETTKWRGRAFRNLIPQAGPHCLSCHQPSSLHWVSGGNPNGNGHRPFYRCLTCDAFTTWGDLRGVRPGNQLCDCGKPSRESVTGRMCRRGPGLVYWRCAEQRCQFFVWD